MLLLSPLGNQCYHFHARAKWVGQKKICGFPVSSYKNLGTVHYLWQGVAPKRNVFCGNNFADPTIKKVKNLITQPQISIKK
jgi:hypothetical protein